MKHCAISGAFCRPGGVTAILLIAAAMAAAIPNNGNTASPTPTPTATATAGIIPKGSVAVSIGTGQVEIHNPDGSMQRTLNSGADDLTAGSAFDSSGKFYVTGFDAQRIDQFDETGTFLGTFGSGFSANPESILFDAAGNAFVGQAQSPGSSPGTIFEFDSTGAPKAQFTVAVESRGTDWIDLAADQCTMHYTSEGVRVLRFNVCTNTQLGDFNTAPLPGSNAYAHRILTDGGELIADSTEVVRLDSGGNQIRTYTFPSNPQVLFAINLDPDGTSFWTGDLGTGTIFRVDIASGNIISQFTTSNGFAVGISVKGEIVVSEAGAKVAAPAPISSTGNPGQTVDGGTFTLTNTSSITETFTTVTLGLTEPGLISKLDLNAAFDESNSTGSSTSPSSSTVITMNPPIVLAGGAAANFSLQVTLAGAAAAASAQSNRSVILASLAPEGGGGWAWLILALMILVPTVFPRTRARWRRRLLVIVAMAFIAAASQVGCDPCPKCTHGAPAPKSTVISMDAAAGTTPQGAAVRVSGVPAQLSTVTRK